MASDRLFFTGPDRLPLGLELPQLRRRLIPVGRIGQRFRLHAQRFFLGEILGPDFFQPVEIFVSSREEAIAGGSESIPDRLFAATRHRANRLPVGLQLLDGFGRFDPARRVGERLRLLAERGLAGKVLGPLDGLARQSTSSQRVQTMSCAVLKRRHSASAWARGTSAACLPLLLQLAHFACDGLGILERGKRFHLRAQLLLHADVRPTAASRRPPAAPALSASAPPAPLSAAARPPRSPACSAAGASPPERRGYRAARARPPSA